MDATLKPDCTDCTAQADEPDDNEDPNTNTALF